MKTVHIIGAGPGASRLLTVEAVSAIKDSDCVIGAARLLASFKDELKDKECVTLIAADKIINFIKESDEKTFCILLSGDIGFYSGAKRLIDPLNELACYVQTYCGISAVVYFASILGISWDDGALLSMHGIVQNNSGAIAELRAKNKITGFASHNKKTFCLTDTKITAQVICQTLVDCGLGGLYVSVGEKLSYHNERITGGKAAQLAGNHFDPLSVVYIKNDEPLEMSIKNFNDSDFIRGDVPMTKEEVRILSLAKLNLKPDSIIWDVGAGTGAVSCCAAVQSVYGKVYAIEKNCDAVELIRQNREKHKIHNIEIVEGSAPSALENLPPPDSVFIGGTSGELENIFDVIRSKNKAAHIVVNTVTLETLSEITRLLKKMNIEDAQIRHITAARSQKTGSYHLMKAENPVFIINFSFINL
ncbi:precorrin-6Y C5,15-methyltransferase [Spirochaetia bacterium]|nr:precorrin-6Y C5,15-methyltransferase [Spirochaetia bacterium]